jgi:hypothetical protein
MISERVLELIRSIHTQTEKGDVVKAKKEKEELDKLLEEYNVKLENVLNPIRKARKIFNYTTEYSKKLLVQLIFKYKTGWDGSYTYHHGKNNMIVEMNDIQSMDIRAAFKHYQELFIVKQEELFFKFLNNYRLHKPSQEEIETYSEITEEERKVLLDVFDMYNKEEVAPEVTETSQLAEDGIKNLN